MDNEMDDTTKKVWSLEDNLEAYTARESELKLFAWGNFVVFHEGQLIENYDSMSFLTFEDALFAITPFLVGNSPLIKRVGEEYYMRPGNRPTSYMPPRPTSSARAQGSIEPVQTIFNISEWPKTIHG
jgi:hypothetical protein